MNKQDNNFRKAIAVSYTLLGSILIFGSIGYILNKKLNNENWLVGFLIFGSFIGLYELYKQINK